ncbi:MAG: asparagine synthase-related protein, partial [Candidatus Contendobacter sp.]|nr:asparagine synthase-related protein [Candidatus Contendobacter sp.]
MSGIAGIIHFDGQPVEPGLIEKMTSAMAHRGPDGINHWVKGSVALGQCMLRTTPESLEEHQPLTNEDESLVLVMDGRVDNWEELRRELLGRGAVLRNRADAELVLRAYEIWGRDCLAHIDGDFALVIWDARRREAFCARDRMGNKPFNYHWDGKTFVFASELHTILALSWVSEIFNEGMLAEFLAAEWYSRDETFWQGILRLVAAHLMVVGVAGPQPEQYWEPDLWVTLPYIRDEEYIDHYRELIFDSVRRLSRSHRSVAVEVSGGLDSSAIFCVAEHLRRSGRFAGPCANGYTLSFTDDEKANETLYSQAVAEYLGIPVHEVSPSRVELSWFDKRAHAYLDFPGFPNATMAESLLLQASLKGSRVILNGVGGDEWLAGSRLYYAEEFARRGWHALFTCFATDVEIFGISQTMCWLARYGLLPLLPVSVVAGLRYLNRCFRRNKFSEFYWLSPTMKDLIRRRQAASRQRYQNVHWIGQRELLATRYDAYLGIAREQAEFTYASFGLEPRRPLHTAAFVQFAFSTPERLRLRGDRDKFISILKVKTPAFQAGRF